MLQDYNHQSNKVLCSENSKKRDFNIATDNISLASSWNTGGWASPKSLKPLFQFIYKYSTNRSGIHRCQVQR